MLKQPRHIPEVEKTTSLTLVSNELRQENPFPGLRPFALDESHLFFGRERHVDEILVKLAENRFVTVMGYSGSGKSSLMYCGLLPVLYGGFMTKTGSHWNAIISRPGTSPIDNLVDSIIDQLIVNNQFKTNERQNQKAIITSILRSGTQGLVEVTRYIQAKEGGNILFLIDQFEELLRYKDNLSEEAQNEAQLYVNLIIEAIQQTHVPVYVALTMRSDFIGNCAAFPGLTQWINHSNYLVPQMTREQKKMVIQGPIAVAGGNISERLVKRLLNDVGNNQDQLPILQHALMRTWDYWVENREPGEPIDLRHYQAIGKIREALSLHANEAYDELSIRGKEIAEVLFKNITEKSQDNRGMRRPARLDLIAKLAEADEEEVISVVEHFRRAGRSFLMPSAHIPLKSDSMIELSHESLMRIWKRLSMWVDEEFESAQMYKRLSEAATMYQIGKTGLWRPPDLQLALNWQKKQRPTREWAQRYDEAFERAVVFLDTSRITYEAELKNQEMLQRRVLRRTRATAVILGVAFVVAILFFLLSYIQKIKADEQTRLAERERQEAQVQRELAMKQKAEADRQKALAQQAAEHFAMSMSAVEDAFVVAQRERDRAELALRKAKGDELKAAPGSKEADADHTYTQTEYAKQEFARANRSYMLTVARTLANKSLKEDNDGNLKGLLAMQGYRFHKRYSGKKYDPYIFAGLYQAFRKINGSVYSSISVPGSKTNHIKSLAISSENNAFYATGTDGKILKGDLETLKTGATNFNIGYPSRTIAISFDEKYIINISDSAIIQIYNQRSGATEPLKILKEIEGEVNDVKFIPNSTNFIVASTAKTLLAGNVSGMVKKVVTLSTEVKRIAISPDGRFVAGASWNGQVYLVDLNTYAVTTIADDTYTRVLSINFSPDGQTLVYGVEDLLNKRGLIKLYNLQSKEIVQLAGHDAGVTNVVFSPDGGLLASYGLDKRLFLWLIDNPQYFPITIDNNNGFIWDIAFNKTSEYLIAGCNESEVRVWPTDPDILATKICPRLSRNMTKEEWRKYVGEEDDILFESTCQFVN